MCACLPAAVLAQRGMVRCPGMFSLEGMMDDAASSGNLQVIQWLRGKGCPWSYLTCYLAVENGRVEVLRWARENGCPWDAEARHKAAAKFGYTDDFGNLDGYSDWEEEESDDEYGDSDEVSDDE